MAEVVLHRVWDINAQSIDLEALAHSLWLHHGLKGTATSHDLHLIGGSKLWFRWKGTIGIKDDSVLPKRLDATVTDGQVVAAFSSNIGFFIRTKSVTDRFQRVLTQIALTFESALRDSGNLLESPK